MKMQHMLSSLLDDTNDSKLVAKYSKSMPYKYNDIKKMIEFFLNSGCFIPISSDYNLSPQSIYNQGVFSFGDYKFMPRLEINSERQIQLYGTEQEEVADYIKHELKLIRDKLTLYSSPPFKNCIKESLIRHPFLRKEIYIFSNTCPKDEKEVELWWPYFLWKFSWLLLIYEPDLFEQLIDKIKTDEKNSQNGFVYNLFLRSFTEQVNDDFIYIDFIQVCKLLIEHQMFTEFQYCLSIYKQITYEEFINGKLPDRNLDTNILLTHKELSSSMAKRIFNKACEAGFCTLTPNGYDWKGDKQLLAYFTEKMSLYLEINKGKLDKDGNQTISWRPFEQLFNVKRIQSAKSSYMKYNTKFTPPNFERIDQLFNNS